MNGKKVAIVGGSVMCRVEGAVVEIRNAENLQRTVLIQSSSPNRSAAISSNGERIVTVSPDGAAELWNAKDGKLIAALNKDLRATRQLQQADTGERVSVCVHVHVFLCL